MFKSVDLKYRDGNFETTKRPKSPSPERRDFEKKATVKPDKVARCTYIHPTTGRRCLNKLGLYPQYCRLHTIMIQNVYIDKSQIEGAGNGVFAGPHGFRKGDIIGRYSHSWNAAKFDTLKKRCSKEDCWNYVFCLGEDVKNDQCWDGLDLRSTIMRNANDAHASEYRNNSCFLIKKGDVFVVASRNISPNKEIFVSYGKHYWQK